MTTADIAELHARAGAATRRYVEAIRPDHWDAPTPCADWDVRQLLTHIVSENLWVTPLVEGKTIEEVGDAFDGDVLGDDPLGAFVDSMGKADAAFGAPGAMEAPIAVSYGPISGHAYAEHRFLDVLVHGWDLAKATGHDTGMDPELVEACWRIAERERAMFTESAAFARPLDVADDVPLQTRLLALLGREA